MPKSPNHTGLLLKKTPRKAWIAGSRKATLRFGGDLNPLGDWRQFIPPFEPQSRPGFDPQSCALINTARAYITLARFQGFTDFIPDASERYSGVFAGTGSQGTDPYDAAESIRLIAGLLPTESMPWTQERTFDEFYDRKVARLNLPLGQALLDNFEFGFQLLWPFGSKLTPQEKAAKLTEYLKRGTVCVSVSGRYRTKRGKLFKEPGERDTHWTLLQREGEISDSYLPQVRQLADGYDHECAMVYFLKRRTPGQGGIWATIITQFMRRWRNSFLGF